MRRLTKISASLLLSAALLSVGASQVNKVNASTNHVLPRAVTKVASDKNYRIYSYVDKSGPHKAIGKTSDFRYAHLESKEYARTNKGTYWNLIVNGRSLGWVNQNYFTRSKISLAKSVNLVNNDNGTFNTKDAVNYATDSTGTAVNPEKVHASITHLKADEPGKHEVEYKYGKAHDSLEINVRKTRDEGVTDADADAEDAPGAKTTWHGSSKSSSPHWNSAHHYTTEEQTNHYTSDSNLPMTLTTQFYQPRFLSLDYDQNDEISQVGVIPEGMAMKNGQLTVSLFSDAKDDNGHLVSYDLNKLTSPYDAQSLVSMPYKEFIEYSKNIKVSPYLKLGHGQSVSDSGKYIYVLANTNKLKNSDESNEIMQINKKDLTINKIWTFKVYNGSADYPRYFHNVSFVNSHLMYGLFHNASKGTYEYWKLEREGDSWIPTEIGATNSELVKNAPVQGFAYDKQNDQFYVGFNDYIFTIDPMGSVLDTQHFDTKRELEGLSVDNGTLYTELTQRAELLKADK